MKIQRAPEANFSLSVTICCSLLSSSFLLFLSLRNLQIHSSQSIHYISRRSPGLVVCGLCCFAHDFSETLQLTHNIVLCQMFLHSFRHLSPHHSNKAIVETVEQSFISLGWHRIKKSLLVHILRHFL